VIILGVVTFVRIGFSVDNEFWHGIGCRTAKYRIAVGSRSNGIGIIAVIVGFMIFLEAVASPAPKGANDSHEVDP
jgi:hypothetical protein